MVRPGGFIAIGTLLAIVLVAIGEHGLTCFRISSFVSHVIYGRSYT
jgi:hypothetical protein